MISLVQRAKYGGNHDQARSLVKLEGSGCRSELLSLSFGVLSDSETEQLEFSCSQLSAEGSFIPAASIDIFVVKSRWKSGTGSVANQPTFVPEMLLKDDRPELTDSYRREFFDWQHIVKPIHAYRPPEVRLTGNACTTLSAGQCKDLWVFVQIPEDIQPNSYNGRIEISSAQGIATLPLEVTVRPFLLDEPTQELLLWYRGTLDSRRSMQHYVTPERMQMELSDIRAHGFNSVSLNEGNDGLAALATEIAGQAGFSRALVFCPPFPTNMPTEALQPVFYVSDEPDLHGAVQDVVKGDALRQSISNAAARAVPSMVSLGESASAATLFGGAVPRPPTIISLLLPANARSLLFRDQLPGLDQSKLFYYWICTIEAANWNRALAGFFLYASGVDGISPYCYHHLPIQFFSPLDDFDPWEPEFTIRGEHHNFRDHMTVYPAQKGLIKTIHWEALRDGIYDLRYLTTLDNMVAAAEASGLECAAELCARARSYVADICQQVGPYRLNADHRSTTEPFAEVAAPDYDRWREGLSQLCSELQALLLEKSPLSSWRQGQ